VRAHRVEARAPLSRYFFTAAVRTYSPPLHVHLTSSLSMLPNNAMSSPRLPTPHEFAVLRVLRADAEHLSRTAARLAATYLPTIELPATWRAVLTRALDERAGDLSCPPLDELQAEYGRPGAWLPAAYHGDATDARFWLVGLQERAVEYLPQSPPSS
jgi:hypothetical protein